MTTSPAVAASVVLTAASSLIIAAAAATACLQNESANPLQQLLLVETPINCVQEKEARRVTKRRKKKHVALLRLKSLNAWSGQEGADFESETIKGDDPNFEFEFETHPVDEQVDVRC